MEFLLIIIMLLFVIGATAKNNTVKSLGQILGAGLSMLVVSAAVQVTACWQMKILPYSYCGELSGIAHMAATSVLFSAATVISMIAYKALKLRKKTRRKK